MSKVTSKVEILEFDGTPVRIGKNIFVIPPLPITKLHKGGFYKLEQSLREAQETGGADEIGNIIMKILDFVFMAIKMNYPDATEEQTIELINTKDLRTLMPALIDVQEGLDELKNV